MGEDVTGFKAWLVACKLPVVRLQLGCIVITEISAINNMCVRCVVTGARGFAV